MFALHLNRNDSLDETIGQTRVGIKTTGLLALSISCGDRKSGDAGNQEIPKKEKAISSSTRAQR